MGFRNSGPSFFDLAAKSKELPDFMVPKGNGAFAGNQRPGAVKAGGEKSWSEFPGERITKKGGLAQAMRKKIGS